MSSLRNKRQYRANRVRHRTKAQARVAAVKRELQSHLLPGERLYRYYCWDMAACECPPQDVFTTVMVIRVGVTGQWKRLEGFLPDPTSTPPTVRCLRCSATWPEPLTGHRRLDRISGGVALS